MKLLSTLALASAFALGVGSAYADDINLVLLNNTSNKTVEITSFYDNQAQQVEAYVVEDLTFPIEIQATGATSLGTTRDATLIYTGSEWMDKIEVSLTLENEILYVNLKEEQTLEDGNYELRVVDNQVISDEAGNLMTSFYWQIPEPGDITLELTNNVSQTTTTITNAAGEPVNAYVLSAIKSPITIAVTNATAQGEDQDVAIWTADWTAIIAGVTYSYDTESKLLTVTLEENLTNIGQYELLIPAGTVVNSKKQNAETSWYFVIEGEIELELANNTSDYTETITDLWGFTQDAYIIKNFTTPIEVTAKNALTLGDYNGEAVAIYTGDDWMTEISCTVEWDATTKTISVTPSEKLKAGTYELYIPTNTVKNDISFNEATSYFFVVEAEIELTLTNNNPDITETITNLWSMQAEAYVLGSLTSPITVKAENALELADAYEEIMIYTGDDWMTEIPCTVTWDADTETLAITPSETLTAGTYELWIPYNSVKNHYYENEATSFYFIIEGEIELTLTNNLSNTTKTITSAWATAEEAYVVSKITSPITVKATNATELGDASDAILIYTGSDWTEEIPVTISWDADSETLTVELTNGKITDAGSYELWLPTNSLKNDYYSSSATSFYWVVESEIELELSNNTSNTTKEVTDLYGMQQEAYVVSKIKSPILVTAKNATALGDNAENVAIYKGEDLESGISCTVEFDAATETLTITPAEAITEPGTYWIWLPYETAVNDLYKNDATAFYWVIQGEIELELANNIEGNDNWWEQIEITNHFGMTSNCEVVSSVTTPILVACTNVLEAGSTIDDIAIYKLSDTTFSDPITCTSTYDASDNTLSITPSEELTAGETYLIWIPYMAVKNDLYYNDAYGFYIKVAETVDVISSYIQIYDSSSQEDDKDYLDYDKHYSTVPNGFDYGEYSYTITSDAAEDFDYSSIVVAGMNADATWDLSKVKLMHIMEGKGSYTSYEVTDITYNEETEKWEISAIGDDEDGITYVGWNLWLKEGAVTYTAYNSETQEVEVTTNAEINIYWWIDDMTSGINSMLSEDGLVSIYSVSGICYGVNVDASVLKTLPSGIYVVNGKKLRVRN